MTKTFNGPPESFLPHREPLQLPLDQEVIAKMTGFDFGTAEYITSQLENVIQSEEYQRAVLYAAHRPSVASDLDRKKGGMFSDFYQRHKSTVSKDTLTHPSSEAVNLGEDPVNAFSPLISIYYLAREKLERERIESNPGALAMPQSPGEKPLQMPGLPAPEPRLTNASASEMTIDAPASGRTRSFAQTQGEDDVTKKLETDKRYSPPNVPKAPVPELTPVKKESAAAGLLRRFSTRRGRQSDREKTPAAVSPSIAFPDADAPDKKMSLRKGRDKVTPPSAYDRYAHNPDLLSPSAFDNSASNKSGLGRSISVNSAELRKQWSKNDKSGTSIATSAALSQSEKPLLQSKQKQSGQATEKDREAQTQSRGAASRTKSLGHARKESIQARRVTRERAMESGVPEETDQDLVEDGTSVAKMDEGGTPIKPVYLKGLFSVSTTSSKPLTVIRADIIRVLSQLSIEYREIKGGFTCRQVHNLDAKSTPPPENRLTGTPSRRRISFAGLRGAADRDRDDHHEQSSTKVPVTPQSSSRQPLQDSALTNSDVESDDDGGQRNVNPRAARAAGETTTQVQNDMGKDMNIRFEILVVKVPLLSLHGLQFKKVDGNTWQYRQLAANILAELRL